MTPKDDQSFERFLIRAGAQVQPRQAPVGLSARVMASVARPTPSATPWRWALVTMTVLLLGIVIGRNSVTGSRSRTVPVQFMLEASKAQTVALAGDFTEWQTVPLRREGGRWVLELRVPKGRHEYGFVLNDRMIVADPRANDIVTSPRGTAYSVLDTEKPQSI